MIDSYNTEYRIAYGSDLLLREKGKGNTSLYDHARIKTTPLEATPSKRAREEEPTSSSIKRHKGTPLRHCILNASLTTEDTVLELFENVRIIGVDKESLTGKRHYHVLGVPKLFKRAARDL
ncbi:hypothetical protein BpHYR1_000453 [Brachionus plicatilis]|uniref:Uncharacterized protein n=1 Tax=Brachionus plicatilis TaxID=10195 RepID=A0A3M7RMR1_BRAPC|nr:hypothetical protein BpHYR1_000453 [Brachionus plicatilis]